jgi:hypothetical protein
VSRGGGDNPACLLLQRGNSTIWHTGQSKSGLWPLFPSCASGSSPRLSSCITVFRVEYSSLGVSSLASLPPWPHYCVKHS